jgi:hypothetical protein
MVPATIRHSNPGKSHPSATFCVFFTCMTNRSPPARKKKEWQDYFFDSDTAHFSTLLLLDKESLIHQKSIKYSVI